MVIIGRVNRRGITKKIWRSIEAKQDPTHTCSLSQDLDIKTEVVFSGPFKGECSSCLDGENGATSAYDY